MSLTLNMVGGGGGGLSATDALLRVQAPAGSTVTITKGTTIKTDLGHENADDHTLYDYYFIIHQSQFDSINPWTVTATLDDGTAVKTIIIDSADEYDMRLVPLPSAYQAVEYIQSSGGQYINTNIPARVQQRAVFDMECTITAGDMTLLGGEGSAQTNAIYAGYNWNSNPIYFYMNFDGTWRDVQNVVDVARHKWEFDYKNGNQKIILDGAEVYSNNLSLTATTSTSTLYMFSRGSNHSFNFVGRAYSLKIYDYLANGNIVLDLVPCYRISDTVVGMYDRVSKTFFSNGGSGAFTAGANV